MIGWINLWNTIIIFMIYLRYEDDPLETKPEEVPVTTRVDQRNLRSSKGRGRGGKGRGRKEEVEHDLPESEGGEGSEGETPAEPPQETPAQEPIPPPQEVAPKPSRVDKPKAKAEAKSKAAAKAKAKAKASAKKAPKAKAKAKASPKTAPKAKAEPKARGRKRQTTEDGKTKPKQRKKIAPAPIPLEKRDDLKKFLMHV